MGRTGHSIATSAGHRLWWEVLKQGLPLALGMVSHALFNIVDLLLVGRLGEDAVAGVHVATTINFLPMLIGNGVSVASMALMSRAYGRGDVDGARGISRWALRCMVWLGIGIGLLGAILVGPSVDCQGVHGAARGVGVHYLLVAQLGTVAMFGVMQTTATMRVLGEVWMPVALLVGANVLNIVLDFLLLFGWDAVGIAAIGAPGAAYASVAARLVAVAVALWWIRRPGFGLAHRAEDRAPPGLWLRVVSLAVPQTTQMLTRAVVVIVLTAIAGTVGGQAAITALGVATRLDTLVLFGALGFASVATTVVGREIGAGHLARARRANWWAAGYAALFGGLLVWLFRTQAEALQRAFVADAGPDVITAGADYLRIAALGLPFAAFGVAAAGGANGAGRVVPPAVIDLIGYGAVMLPLLGWARGDGGELGRLWWLTATGHGVVALIYVGYLVRGRWARRTAY